MAGVEVGVGKMLGYVFILLLLLLVLFKLVLVLYVILWFRMLLFVLFLLLDIDMNDFYEFSLSIFWLLFIRFRLIFSLLF